MKESTFYKIVSLLFCVACVASVIFGLSSTNTILFFVGQMGFMVASIILSKLEEMEK